MKSHQSTQEETNLTIIDQLRRRSTYVPSAEVWELLSTTKATLARWVRQGKFKGGVIRVGNGNRFDPKALADHLAARQN